MFDTFPLITTPQQSWLNLNIKYRVEQAIYNSFIVSDSEADLDQKITAARSSIAQLDFSSCLVSTQVNYPDKEPKIQQYVQVLKNLDDIASDIREALKYQRSNLEHLRAEFQEVYTFFLQLPLFKNTQERKSCHKRKDDL
jgi:hypothetical protein